MIRKSTINRRVFLQRSTVGVLSGALPFQSFNPLRMKHKKPVSDATSSWDVIVVGGSYAGLSAAMTLGRSVRSTLVIDSGRPCNRFTPHTHNFITHDGQTPAAVAQQAKEQVLRYLTVHWAEDRVVEAQGNDGRFQVRTEEGQVLLAKKLLFATGVKDIMPDLPGFADCWGVSVIHCPYCHGYEVKSQRTGILTNGEAALDFGRLIRHWTADLTVFTDGPATFDTSPLQEMNVGIDERKISSIEHRNGMIEHLRFQEGPPMVLDALYARPAFEQHCPLPATLGCQFTEAGYVQADDFQRTSLPGVFAAGDATSPFRAVSVATAAGTRAGAFINHDLIQENH